jgi:hypothetical protein
MTLGGLAPAIGILVDVDPLPKGPHHNMPHFEGALNCRPELRLVSSAAKAMPQLFRPAK